MSLSRLGLAGIAISAGAVLLMCGCGGSNQQSAQPAQPTQPAVDPQAVGEAPKVGPVTPGSGEGRTQAFRVEFSHPAGAAVINDVQFLVAEKMTPSGAGTCWIEVNAMKTVAVRKDDGSVFMSPVAIGSAGAAANASCSVDAAGVKVESSGPNLALTLPVTFAAGFKGPKKVWAIASGPKQHSGWQMRGDWTAN